MIAIFLYIHACGYIGTVASGAVCATHAPISTYILTRNAWVCIYITHTETLFHPLPALLMLDATYICIYTYVHNNKE